MKKTVCIALVIAFSGCIPSLYAITREDIINTEWGPETGYHLLATYIKFYKDGTVRFRSMDQGGGWQVDTTYAIFDGTINVDFPAKVYDKKSDTFTLRYDLIVDSPSVYFSKSLILLNYKVLTEYISVYVLDEIKKVWDYQSPVKPGKKMTIDNNELITTGPLIAYTTDNLNMRDAPSLKGRQLVIIVEMMEDVTDTFLKKDTEVLVLGKTEKKMKINKWENYWYLIKAPVFRYYSLKYKNSEEYYKGNGLVWVYGEFLHIMEDVELPRVPEDYFDIG